jgi:DNA-binding MarR family transcriptional regulator
MHDESDPASTDHLGTELHRAAEQWRESFRQEMELRGFAWHLGASGEVLAHLGPSGVSQAALTERMGLSKQAVQQLLDQLERDGVVRREPDPGDRRAKRIHLTELGRRDVAAGHDVRREIEARYRDRLGKKRFAKFEKALRKLGEAD